MSTRFETYVFHLNMSTKLLRLFWKDIRRTVLDDILNDFRFEDPVKELCFRKSIESVQDHTESLGNLVYYYFLGECDKEGVDSDGLDAKDTVEGVFDEALSARLSFAIIKEVLESIPSIPMENEEEANSVADLQVTIYDTLLHIMKISSDYLQS